MKHHAVSPSYQTIVFIDGSTRLLLKISGSRTEDEGPHMRGAHAALAADQVGNELHSCQAEAALHVCRQHLPQCASCHALLRLIPAATHPPISPAGCSLTQERSDLQVLHCEGWLPA